MTTYCGRWHTQVRPHTEYVVTPILQKCVSVVKSGVTWPPHGGHVLQYMVTFAVPTWSSSFFKFLVQGSGSGLFLSAGLQGDGRRDAAERSAGGADRGRSAMAEWPV